MRYLCDKHEIIYKKEETLNSIFGKYVKFLTGNNFFDSDISEKILKFSINIIEATNGVRNNQSLAHDNKILNYNESILIFNNITNLIKFIRTIEEEADGKRSQNEWVEAHFNEEWSLINTNI